MIYRWTGFSTVGRWLGDGCSVVKPASGWRDLGGWAATCSGRNGWKEEETMRNCETSTAELRRSLTRNLNYSLRENVSTSIVSSNTRRSFAVSTDYAPPWKPKTMNDYNTSSVTSTRLRTKKRWVESCNLVDSDHFYIGKYDDEIWRIIYDDDIFKYHYIYI